MVKITEEQKKHLIKLWFIYGNNGKKHTHFNHRYIQNFIEHNEDSEDFYKNVNKEFYKNVNKKEGVDWNTMKLTDECVDAVKLILNNKV